MPAIVENIQLACALCKMGVYSVFRRLCCKSPPPPRPEFYPVCIGLDNAGKTTLLCILAGESTDNIEPTKGFIVKVSQFSEAILNIKEIGGSEKFRPYWKHYYKDSQAVIYVVNAASDEESLKTSKVAFHEAICERQLKDLPLLVLANCQDLPDARSAKQIEEEFEIPGLCSDRQWMVEACSMTDKDGLREIMERFNKFLVAPSTGESPDDQVMGRI